jgi:hypothetical protein
MAAQVLVITEILTSAAIMVPTLLMAMLGLLLLLVGPSFQELPLIL